MPPPGRLADHPFGMGDLDHHQEQVLPHAAGRLAGLLGGPLGKRLLEILADHLPPDFHPVGKEVGRTAGEPLAETPRQRLDDADSHADRHVGDPIDKLCGERTAHRQPIPDFSAARPCTACQNSREPRPVQPDRFRPRTGFTARHTRAAFQPSPPAQPPPAISGAATCTSTKATLTALKRPCRMIPGTIEPVCRAR